MNEKGKDVALVDETAIRSEILNLTPDNDTSRCAVIIARVMESFFKKGLSAGDIDIERCIRQLIRDGLLISDGRLEGFASYKIGRRQHSQTMT